MVSALSIAAALAMPAVSMAGAVLPARAGQGTEIVGGTVSTLGTFPYIVALVRSGSSHWCGGVLINAYTVLTAAHCSVEFPASVFTVRAGSLSYASGGTTSKVSAFKVHPSYNPDTVDNDMALWHLSTPIAASSTIGYATLPAQGFDPVVNTTATTAGWGTLNELSSTPSSVLRQVSVPIIARSSCQNSYSSDGLEVTTNMFCAGLSTGGKDSCSGDSGGPIIDASTGVLIGVVSWGLGCAEARYPGVYTRIGNYVNYINSNLWTS